VPACHSVSVVFSRMADTAESSKRLTYEDITRLHERQEEIKRANSQYLGEHPELKNLVADFTAAILMQKPDDVFKFARDHFSVYLKDQESKDATAIYYGKHVIGDRRYELVITNSTDRSHWLQLSAKDISPHHPPLNAVFSASEVLSNFGLEDADPSEAAIKVSRCLKPKDGKLILTSDHGASPTVEEFDASVRIQAIARAKKQRQEVRCHCSLA